VMLDCKLKVREIQQWLRNKIEPQLQLLRDLMVVNNVSKDHNNAKLEKLLRSVLEHCLPGTSPALLQSGDGDQNEKDRISWIVSSSKFPTKAVENGNDNHAPELTRSQIASVKPKSEMAEANSLLPASPSSPPTSPVQLPPPPSDTPPHSCLPHMISPLPPSPTSSRRMRGGVSDELLEDIAEES